MRLVIALGEIFGKHLIIDVFYFYYQNLDSILNEKKNFIEK